MRLVAFRWIKMRALNFTFTATLLASAYAGAATAQEDWRPIHPGENLRGELAEGDQVREDGTLYDVYRFKGLDGFVYTVTMTSDELDAFLTIRGPGGLEIDSDDDEFGTDSRLTFSAGSSGEYEIWANSWNADRGVYFVGLEEVPGSSRPIALGDSASGVLGATSLRLEDDSAYDSFVFEGEANQTITIDMESDDFDPYLMVLDPATGEEIGADDDSGDGLNARLTVTLPAAGRYEIIANSMFSDGRGAYGLSVEQGELGAIGEINVIPIGAVLRGELTNGDLTDADNLFFDAYRFSGEAGETVVINLASNEIDPVLYVKLVGSDEWLAENDDLGEGVLDSQVTVTLPKTGEYEIHAVAFDPYDTGSYLLGVGREP